MEYNRTRRAIQVLPRVIILFLALIGVIGGAGNLIYFGQYVNAIGVLACGWLAIPEVKNYWNKIIGD